MSNQESARGNAANIDQREAQLRVFADNLPAGVVYLDTNLRVVFANRAFLALRGQSLERLVGKDFADALDPAAAEIARPHLDIGLTGQSSVYERVHTHPNGEQRWRRVRVVPDLTGDGSVQGMFLLGVDIHDSKLVLEHVEKSEAELRILLDSLPYPMAYMDKALTYRAANRAAAALHGLSGADLIGRDVRTLVSPEHLAEAEPYWRRALAGETVEAERRLRAKGADPRWYMVRYTPRKADDGAVLGLYMSAVDIDALKHNEAALRRTSELLTSHIENSPLAVIEFDQDLRLCRWSAQAKRLFGWEERELLGKSFGDWKFVHEDDLVQVSAMTRALRDGSLASNSAMWRSYRKDGRTIWCEWHNSSLHDETGAVVSILSLAHDVTARVMAEERLVHQATHDALTGLPNRAMLNERLRQATLRAKRAGTRLAALFIDLDRFKEVNDSHGHRAGDELLREITARFLRSIRESDLLVRFSGDEFMIVLEDVAGIDAARMVAEKILERAREPFSVAGHPVHISASVGASIYPDDGENAETLIKNADLAMYRAKELGKNTFAAFSPDLAERSATNRLLEDGLRAAITRNELVLYYQPKVDMVSGDIIGAEALIRWQHPKRGLLGPQAFLHLAEEGELVHDLGDWVLNTAFTQVRKWREAGINDLKIAVNLAAGQFGAAKLAEHIKDLLEANQCNPEAIEVEVTETGMLKDPELVGRTLAQLRGYGVSVAIDDFGTGYSSLSHLKRFPIDTMKIDRGFISDVLTNPDDAAIVTAVIALSKALKLNVIAEGVETEPQRQFLSALGCEAYQGFLFHKAIPADEFAAMYRDQATRLRGNA